MVFHSHGWGGSRSKSASSFTAFLNAGYGVLSFDQRGFGESGGKARIENIDYEGKDVAKLVDARQQAQLGPAGRPRATRGSAPSVGPYGGGYQFVGAFRELMDKKKPLFDALAPEITWWSLKGSLAPSEAVRTEWVSLLSAAGINALPNEAIEGTALGAATGHVAQGPGPGHARPRRVLREERPASGTSPTGRALDIPVLFGQGITDTLFPLHQGLTNFQKALTPQGPRQQHLRRLQRRPRAAERLPLQPGRVG